MRRKLGDRTSCLMVGAPTSSSKSPCSVFPAASQGIFALRVAVAKAKRGAVGSDAANNKRPRLVHCELTGDRGKKADVSVVVRSQVELHTRELDSDALVKWLSVIALGLRTTTVTTLGLGTQHVAACNTAAKLHFTETFQRKHGALLRCFRKLIGIPGSKWTESATTIKGCVVVAALKDCQGFLQSVRRLPQIAGVHASFLSGSSHGRLSRYGRPAAAAPQR